MLRRIRSALRSFVVGSAGAAAAASGVEAQSRTPPWAMPQAVVEREQVVSFNEANSYFEQARRELRANPPNLVLGKVALDRATGLFRRAELSLLHDQEAARAHLAGYVAASNLLEIEHTIILRLARSEEQRKLAGDSLRTYVLDSHLLLLKALGEYERQARAIVTDSIIKQHVPLRLLGLPYMVRLVQEENEELLHKASALTDSTPAANLRTIIHDSETLLAKLTAYLAEVPQLSDFRRFVPSDTTPAHTTTLNRTAQPTPFDLLMREESDRNKEHYTYLIPSDKTSPIVHKQTAELLMRTVYFIRGERQRGRGFVGEPHVSDEQLLRAHAAVASTLRPGSFVTRQRVQAYNVVIAPKK